MKKDKRIIISVMWVIIGIVLTGLGFLGKVDGFWNGMGSGLVVVGIIQLLRSYRFQKNEVYRKKMEVEASDERNRFIRSKAWAWTGYIFILVTSVSIIILKLIGQDLLSMLASATVCFVLILYWGSYLILKKKY